MCGIAGIISSTESQEARASRVKRMNQAMHHRGPDDTGIYTDATASIGMQRLAIFDPKNGHQPMTTNDGRHQLVFNGAIYNFRELRTELEALGHTFKTQCDTEVLLAALLQWEEGALQKLRGMFAFAWWDVSSKRLLIARDQYGIKPLYYHTASHGSLVFASELNALQASGLVPSTPSASAVNSYLDYLAVPAPKTIYRDVRSLRAGECASWQDRELKTRLYWSPGRSVSIPNITPSASPQEFSDGLRAQLESSVRAHAIADVPVGAFLSGGLDSTCLVALMTKLGGRQLKTFSIGFEESDYTEADVAAENARFLGTDHHTTILTGEQIAGDINRIIANMDHPTGDGINTYYVSQAARQGGVTVSLSGLGADELFGGYPSFRNIKRVSRALPIWRMLPKILRDVLLKRWSVGNTQQRKLADMLRHGTNPAALALLQRRVFAESTRQSLLNPGLDSSYSPHPVESLLSAELAQIDLQALNSVAELSGYMTDVLLRDSDMMSMRHSLELRVPFVDQPLITWLAHQPSHFKFTPKTPKSALAKALSDILPPAIHQRPKRGFTLPYAKWMLGPLRGFLEETFSSASVQKAGFFSVPAVQAHWLRFLSGNDTRDWSRVWSLAMLIAFINRPRPISP